ncbi:MAG: hypothetical protein HUJ31_16540 [Pseudomonadales bacterium]|nr:hypothetical protein [Pseudomonadales bacterium]
MVAVKGSKQYQMVVVPHRPWYRAALFCLGVLALAALVWAAWQYGKEQGLALRSEIVAERNVLKRQLEENERLVDNMRQEIADLRVGGEIDSRANEEVRQTVEGLQEQIAELNEEIRFYKGVMVPNAEDKGLRIEGLTLEETGEPGRYDYNLLLTQVVDKHDFIQGGVEVNVVGTQGGTETVLPLNQLSRDAEELRFRFRYFQNIDGQLDIPDGFEPRSLRIIAQSSGRNSQRLDRTFEWQVSGG